MKICIDAGHYGQYNKSPVNGSYYESDINWKLHGYLKSALEAYGVTVITTRTDKNKDIQVYERGRLAEGCDLFLSIHSNACNTESVDYPLACCSVNGKADEIGQKLADTVACIMGTSQKGRILRRKGDNGDWYGVLRGAASVGVAGVLLEHSFHTNKRAVQWLMDDNNLKRLAAAEAETIAEHYGLKKSTPDKLYRVQVGAFRERKNAEAMLDNLKKAGFAEAFIN
ncbi:MAG: N-acetylmuramoyl-L-alanine amidase [Ruminococcus sp.]|nr:N-acetylmuramoyl-L-alanine amidase [Ruminococcus sp.]